MNRCAKCLDRIAQTIAKETEADADPGDGRKALTRKDVLRILAKPRNLGDADAERVWHRFEHQILIASKQARSVISDRVYADAPPTPLAHGPRPDPELIDCFVEVVIETIETQGSRFPALTLRLQEALKELGFPEKALA